MADKKIVVLGASGMVGMATVEALLHHIAADVTAYDRKPDAEGEENRRQRRANFENLKSEDLLDKRQASWINRELKPLAALERGSLSQVDDIKQALSGNPDCILITSGIPRKAGRSKNEKFSPLIPLNAPYFRELGEAIANAYITALQSNPTARFPTIINTGNPVDTLTELLVKVISEKLSDHMQGLYSPKPAYAIQLGKTIIDIPKKIMGQSGVIDGSRAAFALSQTVNVPLEDIIEVPVLGPHNANMVVDFDTIRMRKDNQETSLEIYMGRPLEAVEKDKISQLTRDGAAAVLADIQEKTGQAQTSVFGTAAALTHMAYAALGEQKRQLYASVYDPYLGQGMSRQITLNRDGAGLINTPLSGSMLQQLQKGRTALKVAFDAAKEHSGLEDSGKQTGR